MKGRIVVVVRGGSVVSVLSDHKDMEVDIIDFDNAEDEDGEVATAFAEDELALAQVELFTNY